VSQDAALSWAQTAALFGINRLRCGALIDTVRLSATRAVPRFVKTVPIAALNFQGAGVLRPAGKWLGKNSAKMRYPANFVYRTLPLPRGPAVAQMCVGAFPLAFEGTAQASRHRRPVSS